MEAWRVRSLLTQLEELAPARFVLLVGVASATLRSIPAFFLRNPAHANWNWVQLIGGAAFRLLWWLAALLLWWVAVRRRRFSIWKIAWHLVLALALADGLVLALSLVPDSIETHGRVIKTLAQAASTVVWSNLDPILIRSPFRFLGAVALLALGRVLLGVVNPAAREPLLPTDREAVT
jgi:hypothetical protein